MSDTATRALRLLNDPDTSVLEVSRHLNVSPQRIYQILSEHDVAPPTQRKPSQTTKANT